MVEKAVEAYVFNDDKAELEKQMNARIAAGELMVLKACNESWNGIVDLMYEKLAERAPARN